MISEYLHAMKKKAVKNQIVEHLTSLCDASVHHVGKPDDVFAQVYHYHNTLEVAVIVRGWGPMGHFAWWNRSKPSVNTRDFDESKF